MKNTILLLLLLTIFSCGNSDDSEVLEEPTYTVEGKWLWSPDPDYRTFANTMYEFEDGTRYTSYANCTSSNPCSNSDFNALDATDRIPGTENYTFNDYTLTIDGITQTVSFRCDGGILVFENGGTLWRLSSDCQ
tara:strand:+ start:117 stop:518 length:402 start_codon:yes stop_codon:yes gene_type:complete